MILSTSIRSWFGHLIRWVKTIFSLKSGLIFLLVVLFSTFVAVMVSENLCWISPYLGLTKKNETLTFLGIGMGGILLALQAVIANRRAKAMENAANAQAEANRNTERGQRQERLKNAIEHLGHNSDSVRLGGAYELFHLAQDTEDLRQTVMDILCAHIRRTTGERKYREDYPSKPSEEVQSLLTLLFVQEYKVFKGCHINLQGSWLNGADLQRAHLEKAVLTRAYLQWANLYEAKLQGSDFEFAHLQKAQFVKAQMQEARLLCANLQGAHLLTQMQGAVLHSARLQGAFLGRAYLQGSDLSYANLQGAELSEAHMEGANLGNAHLEGAFLREVHLQAANLHGTNLRGTTCQDRQNLTKFVEHIRSLIGEQSSLSEVKFDGGLGRTYLDFCVESLSDENAKKLREKLESHIDKPASNQLPEDSGAITGAYTEEEAEEWIAEYQEAMSAVPKADNGQ